MFHGAARTQRNPMASSPSDCRTARRDELRNLSAVSFHEPPRSTTSGFSLVGPRAEPSLVALAYSPCQPSAVNSHRYPCMSYSPQGFGASFPTSGSFPAALAVDHACLPRIECFPSASVSVRVSSPKLYFVFVPARQAYSHSASDG